MAEITITMKIDVESLEPGEFDPDDSTGLSQDAFERIMGDLRGYDDVEIEYAP